MKPSDFLKPINYKKVVKEPIDLATARALAVQILEQDQVCQGPSWFGALARCVVTLCDEVRNLRNGNEKP